MANLATRGSISSKRNTLARSVSPGKGLGAEFFPVASGVQVPYVGGDARDGFLKVSQIEKPILYNQGEYASTRPGHNSMVWTSVPAPNKPGEELMHENHAERLLQVLSQHPHTREDKSSTLSKNYLKTISDGFTFADEVICSRAPHTVPYKDCDAVYKAGSFIRMKPKVVGLVGRHDARGPIKRHMPCHLKGPRKLKLLTKSKVLPHGRRVLNKSSSEILGQNVSEKASKEDLHHEWDEHCLASISKSTAEWIVKEHLSGPEKERLAVFLKERYKPSQETDSKPEKSETRRESRAKSSHSKEKEKEIRKEEKSEATELNYTPSFTLPSRVGDKKLDTQNVYQLELLAGAQPIPAKKHSDKNTIVLGSNEQVKFQKHLQDNFPQGAKPWFPAKGKKKKMYNQVSRQTKGLHRWKELPSVIQDDILLATKTSSHSDVDIATISAGYKLRKKIKEDLNVVKIAEEWRSKWFLERRWQNSTTEELMKGMVDINDHVRLSAVAACSKAAMIRKAKKEEPKLQGVVLDKGKDTEIPLQAALEPELLDRVNKLLHDKNCQVRIAAAITLYTLNKKSDEAEKVLLWAIEHGGGPEKWAATQCLAMAGTVCDRVINELVRQLHSDNSVRTIEAGALLAELSQYSGIVHSLIAELLNSNSWKDRVTASKVIPKLRGVINKDMTQKLSYLMWNDWSKDVRSAAAQALGKTGNGKLVHDTLRERIMTGNERAQVDALKKLSNLGIMTVRLLPALIDCFRSEYVSVRIEAAMAAGQLRITDDKLLEGLLDMASNDRSWKVKAHAIKALGCVGIVTERVIDVLLWAIRYEKVAAVRAEACNAVAALRIRDERMLSVLQDRLVVESDDLVKREAIFTLQTLGVEPTGDLEMIEAIRTEVHRLCTRDLVVAHILEEDNAHAYTSDYKRLFTTSETEPTPERPPPPSRELTMASRASRASRAASQASQRGWDPILAGYQAREIMSREPTPGGLHMEHSYLPMDLNSASSENSSVVELDDEDEFSDEPEEGEEEEEELRLTHSTQFELPAESTASVSRKTQNASEQGSHPNEIIPGTATSNGLKGEDVQLPETRDHEPSQRSAVSPSESTQLDLCSEPESSKDDAELMKLARDDEDEEQTITEPSEVSGNSPSQQGPDSDDRS
ncbi:HEAT repeat-containing protein 4 isoform X1 [Nematostella vectensis]|uniref:HEAT repeat-containing protein 4 isoform X1 n=1 Tax=Nematostella vectensis TaxID=45351 RepID=UPI002077677F|nr:HEAT repeat-containing protein 4 isoform X1 [Nematostella vectensis]